MSKEDTQLLNRINAIELRMRTEAFALDVVCFCMDLPTNPGMRHISNQLIRSATSVAANYRAACRGRSKAEFVAKLGIVEEEADESYFWLGILASLNTRDRMHLNDRSYTELLRLRDEADQLLAITISSRKTARTRS